ncbi:hypothetical protein EV363DRAFT_1349635 [Boletus edulis]|uniref:Uncharacterized protein n=1 Tax=Boletus edulis BED1 TaxID=1328754 RepID=A0AAD4C3Y1_BOLED|nr:hypothetical protein EV363DRAFT_1349635 [Boletus edulis]KAF8447213.1 hypothetical protein L210DRAFT_3525260 [Boletus edulis BED1]
MRPRSSDDIVAIALALVLLMSDLQGCLYPQLISETIEEPSLHQIYALIPGIGFNGVLATTIRPTEQKRQQG